MKRKLVWSILDKIASASSVLSLLGDAVGAPAIVLFMWSPVRKLDLTYVMRSARN